MKKEDTLLDIKPKWLRVIFVVMVFITLILPFALILMFLSLFTFNFKEIKELGVQAFIFLTDGIKGLECI